jgi:hypothetical protein
MEAPLRTHQHSSHESATAGTPIPRTQKHTITISYYALNQPEIALPEALKEIVDITFIDLMDKDFLALEHGGVKVYRTYKHQHAGIVEEWSDYWFATELWTDWENDICFDGRELPEIPVADLPAYQAMYPDSTLKQSLAYAIDQGLLPEDDLEGPE